MPPMAKHKAPTEVTVVAHEEQSSFAALVEKHWMKFAVVAIAITIGIVFSQYRSQQAEADRDKSWGMLMAELEQDRRTGRLTGDAAALAGLATKLKGSDAAPWALYLEAQNLRKNSKPAEAVEVLMRLREQYPSHPLVTQRYQFEGSAAPLTLLDRMISVYEVEGTWEAEHPALYANPDLPAGAPKVRIKTDKGDIVVALFNDRAPKLSENFLKLAEQGFYDGTRVHKVAPGMLVEAGDPNSKDGDAETWGTEGADYTIEKEDTGLSHFEGYLGMVVKPGEEDPNGSLFYLTAGPLHFLNHRNIVFGKVVEGLDVVKEISNAATEAPSTRPLNPISILGTEVVPGA